MSCSVPSADVTVKVSVRMYPRRPALRLRRSLFQSTSTRHRCRCWTCVWSLPCRFAPWRSLRPHRHRDRQCAARAQAGVFNRRASTPSPVPMTGAGVVPLIVHVCRCHLCAVCRRLRRRFPLTYPRRPLLNCVEVVIPESTSTRHQLLVLERAVWACRVGLRREGPASPASSSRSSVCRPCSSWCLPSLRPHPHAVTVPMTGASLDCTVDRHHSVSCSVLPSAATSTVKVQ